MSEIPERVYEKKVEALEENPSRIETFGEIFEKRKRLREEADKARKDNMKRANPRKELTPLARRDRHDSGRTRQAISRE